MSKKNKKVNVSEENFVEADYKVIKDEVDETEGSETKEPKKVGRIKRCLTYTKEHPLDVGKKVAKTAGVFCIGVGVGLIASKSKSTDSCEDNDYTLDDLDDTLDIDDTVDEMMDISESESPEE